MPSQDGTLFITARRTLPPENRRSRNASGQIPEGLIKRRTVANEACDNTRVSVNGRPAKASYDVKVGDRIEIQFGARTVAVEVLQVAENVRKDDAVGMYREITP